MSVFESASFTSNSSSESMANTPDDLASTMSLLMPDDVNFQSLWLAMQITDTAFPTGALGHSQGLESAFYYDFIHVESEKKSLKRFIELCLEQVGKFCSFNSTKQFLTLTFCRRGIFLFHLFVLVG